MGTRIITGIVALCMVAFFLTFRGWAADLMLIAFLLVAQWEVLTALKSKYPKIGRWPVYIFGILLLPAFLWKGLTGAVILLSACLVAQMTCALFEGRSVDNIIAGSFTLLYPSLPFAFLIALNHWPDYWVGLYGLLIAVAGSSICDIGAYFTGTFIGKHKLCPEISPKKTVEGAIGGFVWNLIFCMGVGYFAQGTGIPLWHFAILAVLSSLAGELGDLAASQIKRFCGIKDYGKVFPGHGGVMDRFDGIVFNAVAVFGYFTLFLL